ncbi:hypothetical protein EVAR_24218_1 [Eumeta japonica]|uniref:Uncharacterized protein n=1 Tax=Eumeta variegata TaxID=151549 RepID=A0A4C1W7A5_EUMVA|nr:hypothetical protein EVAR_24218_1 [Eumeta japonica]
MVFGVKSRLFCVFGDVKDIRIRRNVASVDGGTAVSRSGLGNPQTGDARGRVAETRARRSALYRSGAGCGGSHWRVPILMRPSPFVVLYVIPPRVEYHSKSKRNSDDIGKEAGVSPLRLSLIWSWPEPCDGWVTLALVAASGGLARDLSACGGTDSFVHNTGAIRIMKLLPKNPFLLHYFRLIADIRQKFRQNFC